MLPSSTGILVLTSIAQLHDTTTKQQAPFVGRDSEILQYGYYHRIERCKSLRVESRKFYDLVNITISFSTPSVSSFKRYQLHQKIYDLVITTIYITTLHATPTQRSSSGAYLRQTNPLVFAKMPI